MEATQDTHTHTHAGRAVQAPEPPCHTIYPMTEKLVTLKIRFTDKLGKGSKHSLLLKILSSPVDEVVVCAN